MNGDGRLDLTVANFNSSTVSVLLGNGDGSFGSKTDFGTGSEPASVAVGDVNADGLLDLAVANSNSNTISVLLGNGDGTFGSNTDFGTGSEPASAAVGDVNADGLLDLAVANFNSDTISVLLGSGDGIFGPKADFGTGRQPSSVAIGDVSGDGWLDLAVTNFNSGTVSVLLSNRGTTSVGVEDLEASTNGDRVQIRWRLSAEARSGLQGIVIPRATNVDGPYVVRSAAPLQPAIEMSFEDGGLTNPMYWYRLVLIRRDGSQALAGPIGVRMAWSVSGVTALQLLFEPADGGPIQIQYTLGRAGRPVWLAIYDVRGRVVWSSERSVRAPGRHTQSWDRRDRSGVLAPRGVYFVGLHAEGMADSKKLLLVHR